MNKRAVCEDSSIFLAELFKMKYTNRALVLLTSASNGFILKGACRQQ